MSGQNKQTSANTNGPNRAHFVLGLLATLLVAGLIIWLGSLQNQEDLNPDSANSFDQQEPRDQTAPIDAAVTKLAEEEPCGEIRTAFRRTQENADRNGWTSEVVTDAVDKQLKSISSLLTRSEPIESRDLTALLLENGTCTDLFPRSLETVFDQAPLLVERMTAEPTQSPAHHGRAEVAAALEELARPFRNSTETHTKFKVVGIELLDRAATTRQLVAISGQTRNGMLEQNATWTIRWELAEGHSKPRIQTIDLEDFEQVKTVGKPGPLFTDCTRSVLEHNTCYREQFLKGYNEWLRRLQQAPLIGYIGLAIGDVNGDGLDDLYVCEPGGLPNRLFLQNPDGTADEVSASWAVDWLHDSRSALLVDFDNDGYEDLAVAMRGGVLLAANVDGRQFEFREFLTTGEDTTSLAAADFDNDGDLDLYVCVYGRDDLGEELGGAGIPTDDDTIVYYDSNDGGRNSLFRNEHAQGRSWEFVDVSVEVGLDTGNQRYTFAASWEDYDNDGDQDLYVANDFGGNNLYRNNGPNESGDAWSFVEVAPGQDIEDRGFGMGIAWGDFNRDGWMDAYVSNMFSAAGSRITRQVDFQPGADKATRAVFERMAKGNTLLENGGDGRFRDVSGAAAVQVGRWAWSSNFMDLNNDGWEDLIVANGYVTGEDSGDL